MTAETHPFAPGARQFWGTPEDLHWNQRGRLSPLQHERAGKARKVVPLIALGFGAILLAATWAAFRTDPNSTRVIVGLGLLILFPVGVLVHVGRVAGKASRVDRAERAIGIVEVGHRGPGALGGAQVKIDGTALPLLAMWARQFPRDGHCEVYFSRADKNVLSAVVHPGPPDPLHLRQLELIDQFGAPGRKLSGRCGQCHPPLADPDPTTAEELRPLAADLLSHWGNADDLRQLLPPLLAFTADGMVGSLDLADLAQKLAAADFGSWPDPERDAVRRFLAELWIRVRRAPQPCVSPATFLVAVAASGLALAPFFDAWDTDPAGTPALARLVLDDLDFDTGGICDPRWPEWATPEFVAWLDSPTVHQSLNGLFGDERHRVDARFALDLLTTRTPTH